MKRHQGGRVFALTLPLKGRAWAEHLDARAAIGWLPGMDLDALLHHYFGTALLETLSPETLARGKEALAIDFGVEREPGRKFALWVVMDAIGTAPLPAEAFEKHPALKRAAEDYLTASERMQREE